ncbi:MULTISPECIES: DUF6400 family protein [unclassified Streptomyces]|uniref:DUF6400 family protein n=1 Tax=unclassified Streptomyces TaxID=2593676 RepID=UPI002E339932|nr:DUF6400 family protein [Streptomyces sp. NBC_01278]
MAPHQPTSPTGPDTPALIDFTVDLTAQEVLRRAQVMDALGPDWDPIEVLRGEEAAYDLLYSGLDAEQQRVYDGLVAAGVLAPRGDGRAAA